MSVAAKPENPWVQAAGYLSKMWKDFASALVKNGRKSIKVGDPTPAQLLAAVQNARVDLAAAVANNTVKAAAKATADAEYATSEQDVSDKQDAFDNALTVWAASVTPIPPE